MKWFALIVFLLCFIAMSQSRPAGPLVENPQTPTAWIRLTLQRIETIKPGMTRGELERLFTVEGGLSTRTHRTDVYRECPYVKVDVEFRASEGPIRRDVITSLSRPYLARPARD